MLKDKLVNIGGVVVNTDIIQSVVPNDDEGTVRIYISMLNENDPTRPSFWIYEGELAQKIKAFFLANAQEL